MYNLDSGSIQARHGNYLHELLDISILVKTESLDNAILAFWLA